MYTLCSQVLDREIELLRGIGEAQKQVWTAVVKREWTDFEVLLPMTGRIGAELEKLEGERKALFSKLPGFSNDTDIETGFYRLITSLPPDEQKNLTTKYRELKMAGLRVQINNENLLAYITGVKATISAFIESAFPDRKGRVYTRSGTVVSQDMRCMVLNHSL
ncbi:MAG: hypothetical protein LBB77_06785 [Treponema sp.]|jgi:hypothetical protein|nr:hypothetical protein [Treponema sp.]